LRRLGELLASGCIVGLVAGVVPARAQRASENAVKTADDAFGTSVGLENTGIYSEHDVRGFSPLDAGNSRIDGIYFDQVTTIPSRLKAGSAIRVGFAAEAYPFPAPTGIVDTRFRPWPTELGASLAATYYPYGGHIFDLDLRLPVVKDHVGLLLGGSVSEVRMSSGARNRASGFIVRPIFRFAGFELAPFAGVSQFTLQQPNPIVVLSSDFLPKLPETGRYFGQPWARGKSNANNYGATLKGSLAKNLSLRAGVFRSNEHRISSYSEIFTMLDRAGNARHRVIANPDRDTYSLSGEAQVAYVLPGAGWDHRLIAGYRFRDRHTESGGSDSVSLRDTVLGRVDPVPEPSFTLGTVNEGRVRQSSIMFGYIGRKEGLGVINLGLQRARYRSDFLNAASNVATSRNDSAWLYNATVGFDIADGLSVFAATQRGLEDSGIAPVNAVNANEQLPATRTTQYEGGVRWKFASGQAVVNAFQITKPYFSFDSAGVFRQVGQVRHRGVEASLTGHFLEDRLNVLIGAVIMRPRVSGSAVDAGTIGERPTGTAPVFARIDASYRTELFGGLTPTFAVTYTSSHAIGSKPLASLGGEQLTVPARATVDLGLRQQFKIGSIPASYRIVVQNVLDTPNWRVIAANTAIMGERRRVLATIAADF
jgi:iron complex outermembrane recepter protein